MTKLCLSYAGYANHLTGQLGDPAFARPIPLTEGVLGYFDRNEHTLISFHIEHFQSFNNWKALRELVGKEVTNKLYELHQEIGSLELPSLSGLTEDELSTTMQQSLVHKDFEVDWPDGSEVVERLQSIVSGWERGL